MEMVRHDVISGVFNIVGIGNCKQAMMYHEIVFIVSILDKM
jgi:hypothetical protein